MGRQGYVTRLALGRSAYDLPEWPEPPPEGETQSHSIDAPSQPTDNVRDHIPTESIEYVQHYDVRGHPENSPSRSAARRSRRAQNDVLATVGVCVNVDKNGKLVTASSLDSSFDKAKVKKLQEIATENLVGIWLGVVVNLVNFLSTFFVEGLRERFQTFNFYNGIPFKEVCSIERKHGGGLRFLFAGLPAVIAFQLLRAAREIAIDNLYELALERSVLQIKSRNRRRWAKKTLDWAKLILEVITFTLIAPVQIFSTLQQLGLLPAWPLLPFPKSFSFGLFPYFLFPKLPTQRNVRSYLAFAVSLSLSPVPLFFASDCVSNALNNKMTSYAVIAIPGPDRPDNFSTKAYEDHNDVFERSGSSAKNRASGNVSLMSEIKKDLKDLVNTLVDISTSCRTYFSNTIKRKKAPYEKSSSSTNFETSFIEHLNDEELGTNHPLTPARLASLRPSTAVEVSDQINDSTPIIASSSSTRTPSPSSFESEDEEDPQTPSPSNNAVQITTRTGSTDTLHMNVEFNASVPGAPVYTSSFSASPRSGAVETVVTEEVTEGVHHRVTTLTTYGAGVLGEHLIHPLCSLLALPMDALYIRAVALAFLGASGASPAALGLRSTVYPLNSWFGAKVGTRTGMGMGLGVAAGTVIGMGHGARWRQVTDYMGKMALCVALETMVGLGVWQVGMGVAWWVGKRWFRWGKL